jgi:ribonuclease T2
LLSPSKVSTSQCPFGFAQAKGPNSQISPEPGKRLRPEGRDFHVFREFKARYSRVLIKGKVQMRVILALLMAMTMATAAEADGEKPGDFDYYVMSLGWSSNWCALEGDARHDPQCDAGRKLTWTLHGLWPQYERGFPAYCRSTAQDPSRAATTAMADIMGGSGLAFYEWKKHGRCSALSVQDYYATMRKAYASVTIPPIFTKINKDLKVPASVIEGAFLERNPQLSRDQITVTCKSGMIQEVRICLTKDLEPRLCGADVIRDCTLNDAELDAVR